MNKSLGVNNNIHQVKNTKNVVMSSPVSSPTHGHDGIEVGRREVVEVVGGVAGDVNADFLHHRLRDRRDQKAVERNASLRRNQKQVCGEGTADEVCEGTAADGDCFLLY